MTHDYTLYSFAVSMYSGKTRGYMNYKKLNYIDKYPTFRQMASTFPAETGASAVPIVQTRKGEWLQDTTIIAEELERRHPEPTIAAPTPIQKTLSLLLEAWGDEFWLPIAMHYRWSYKAENKPQFLSDVSKGFFEGLPRFLARFVTDLTTRKLDLAGPFVGFPPHQHAMIEKWTEGTLDDLDHHFSQHDYLLGGRPTIADFSLLASFFGHLNWDPAPKRILMPTRPHLTTYVERMKAGEPATGPLIADDGVPETLMPIIKRVFDEFIPMVESMRDQLTDHIAKTKPKSGDALPRFIAKVGFPKLRIVNMATFPMAGSTFRRCATPYTLWMMQRAQRLFAEMPQEDQSKVDDWFKANFGRTFGDLDLGPELQRAGLSTVLA